MKIVEQKTGKWNEDDRLELARLLVKGGYQVAIRKVKNATTGKYQIYVEAVGDSGEEA